MTDLVCTHCGAIATYADAYIMDRRDPEKHEFVRPMHPNVDVVHG